jgi:hypothetical protein
MAEITPEQQARDEAERLALLPAADQQAVVALYRGLASDPLATPACKRFNKARAAALEKHLRRLNHGQKTS